MNVLTFLNSSYWRETIFSIFSYNNLDFDAKYQKKISKARYLCQLALHKFWSHNIIPNFIYWTETIFLFLVTVT